MSFLAFRLVYKVDFDCDHWVVCVCVCGGCSAGGEAFEIV